MMIRKVPEKRKDADSGKPARRKLKEPRDEELTWLITEAT